MCTIDYISRNVYCIFVVTLVISNNITKTNTDTMNTNKRIDTIMIIEY